MLIPLLLRLFQSIYQIGIILKNIRGFIFSHTQQSIVVCSCLVVAYRCIRRLHILVIPVQILLEIFVKSVTLLTLNILLVMIALQHEVKRLLRNLLLRRRHILMLVVDVQLHGNIIRVSALPRDGLRRGKVLQRSVLQLRLLIGQQLLLH